ncbi:MAG: hypothetical protein E2O76_08960 [Caldithrix sp.]|nr:MAG: hypothetical protein E2O76_08960 [Caldithrix sp.]
MKPMQKLSFAVGAVAIIAGLHSANAPAKSKNSDSGFAQITVVVTDNAQAPVANALVTATTVDSQRTYSGVTDGSGTVVLSGLVTSVSPGRPSDGIPQTFTLFPNYPNPFSSATQIEFDLQKPAAVTIEIRNIRGQFVKTLHRGQLAGGSYQIGWDDKAISASTRPSESICTALPAKQQTASPLP